jgi:hypothetical protein
VDECKPLPARAVDDSAEGFDAVGARGAELLLALRLLGARGVGLCFELELHILGVGNEG